MRESAVARFQAEGLVVSSRGVEVAGTDSGNATDTPGTRSAKHLDPEGVVVVLVNRIGTEATPPSRPTTTPSGSN